MASGSSGTSTGDRQRHADIFVSSTSRDLAKDYRPVARRAIEETLRQHAIMMEDFGAQNGDGSSVSTEEVAAADLVLMVVAWRYGYVPAGQTHSITHLEYLEARRLGKPVLVFLAAAETEARDDLFPQAQRDPEHAEQLRAFRAELERFRAVAYFSTPDELERAVTKAVFQWLRSRPVGRVFPRVVPDAVRDFVGRDEAVRKLMDALRGGTSAAISALVAGMGGVGKSALAGEVARQLASDPTAFPGGIALVRCNDREGLPGLAWIYDQVLAEWGMPLSPAEVAATQDDPEAAAEYRERALRTRLRLTDDSGPLPALVLLDNVEMELPLERALAALSQAGLTELVTARHQPNLPKLALLRLDVLDPGPAAALFAARYQEAGGAWEAARDAEAAARIVALLGGLPLAIELAAADAALEGRSVAALAEQLTAHDRLDPLSDPTDPTKSVRYAFTQSFEKLEAPLQAAFAALGLPAGNDWPRDVIEGMLRDALAEVEGAPTPAEVLRRLAARSLLTLASEPSPAGVADGEAAPPTSRVRLHPLLRDYAGEHYDALPAEHQTATLAALIGAVANFTRAHDEPTAAAFAILAREEPLITETIRAAAEAHAAPQALDAAVKGIGNYIFFGGHWQLGVEVTGYQLAAHRTVGDRRGQGVALNNLGTLTQSQGRSDEAARYYEQALAMLQEVGDRAGQGATLNNLGELARRQGHMEEAARYYEQALAIRREVGDRRGQGVTLSSLGALVQSQGRYEEATRYYEQALAIQREVGHRAGEATTLSNLGLLARSQGRLEEAARYYEQALAIAREVGDRRGEGTTLNNLGGLAHSQGHLAQAQDYLQQALAIFEEIGAEPNARVVRGNLGAIMAAQAAAASPPTLPAGSPAPLSGAPPAVPAEEPVAVGSGDGKWRRRWWRFRRG